jgi:hypothetical protein
MVPVNPTAYALLSARPGAPEPRRVEQTDIAMARVSGDRAPTDRVPDVLGVPALDGGTPCLVRLPHDTYKLVVSRFEGGRVALPAGGGVLAVPDGSHLTYLITEQGVKYRIADDDAVRALGLGGARNRIGLPAGVLALLPDGPVLSRAAAGKG